MPLLTRTTHTARSIALFDIGASSVGVGLGVITDTDVHLLWYTRTHFAYDRFLDYAHYVKSMYAALLDASMAIMSEGVRVADRDPRFEPKHLEVISVVAPPWFFAGVHTEVRTHEKRRPITHGILDELRATACTVIQARPDYNAWQTVAGVGGLLEQRDLSLMVEGYHVAHAREYEAREVALTSYVALAPNDVLQKVREIVERSFPNHTCTVRTSTQLLAAHRVAEAPTGPLREILVEVGGEVTSVAVLEHSILSGIATFPAGIHQLLHACAPKAKNVDEATSVAASIALRGSQDPSTLSEDVRAVLSVWAEGAHDALATAVSGVTPPSTATIAVHPAWYGLYAQALSIEWQQPGLREMRGLTVAPLESTPQDSSESTLGRNVDLRLFTLLGALRTVVT